MTAERVDARVGTDLGPYRIEAVIGRGGMGVVYLAMETRLKRRVALKILPPALADDLDYRARFERESQMAAAIDDPNILPIYEAGEIEGVLFIAMRYVEGTDLEARLRAGPLEPRQVVHLLGQIASALDAAHANGLVHRDVKPGNVLIAAARGDERGDHAYLTDFGLTKLRAQDTSLTRVGTIMGTLDYMAPEQLEGRAADGRADQYALAAIAFRALTGQLPYERDSDAALITAILRDSPPSAHAATPSVPEAVDAVLARGMAKSPADRFTTCAAFMTELRSALGVTSSTTGPTPERAADRRRVGIAVAALATVLIALVGLGFVLGGGTAPAASAVPAGSAGDVTANTDPSDFPNADEAALLAMLPSDVALRCKRGSYDNVFAVGAASARPLASLDCVLPRGNPGEPGYSRLEALKLRDLPQVTGDSVVARTAADHGVPDGDCAVDLPATGTWSIGESVIGRAACWITADLAVVEWSHDSSDLVLRASRGNRDEGSVVELWQSTGQSVEAATRGAAEPSTTGDVFPGEAETVLLAALPLDLARTCERGPYNLVEGNTFGGGGTNASTPVASVECTPAIGSGTNSVVVRAFQYGTGNADFSTTLAVSEVARRHGSPSGDCATSPHATGRWQVGGVDVGAIVCYVDTGSGDAVLYWSYEDDKLLAKATNLKGDSAALYAWFEQNARFIGP